MTYGEELTKKERLDELIKRNTPKKKVCHGLWVDGKLIPEDQEHLYEEEE